MVANGTVPKITQSEEGATYDPIMKKDNLQINWGQSAQNIHNFIIGNDKVPGAWTNVNGEVRINSDWR